MALTPRFRLSLQGLLAWGLLSTLCAFHPQPVTRVFMPLMESVIDMLQPDYVARLSVTGSNGDGRVVMSCTTTHAIAHGDGQVLPPLRSGPCAWMDSIHALVPLVVFLLPVMVWPLQARGEATWRIAGSLVLLPLILSLTAAPLLLGLADWTLHPDAVLPASSLRMLMRPMAFIEMGGGWMLALLAAGVCLRFGQWLAGPGRRESKA